MGHVTTDYTDDGLKRIDPDKVCKEGLCGKYGEQRYEIKQLLGLKRGLFRVNVLNGILCK